MLTKSNEVYLLFESPMLLFPMTTIVDYRSEGKAQGNQGGNGGGEEGQQRNMEDFVAQLSQTSRQLAVGTDHDLVIGPFGS